MSVPTRRILKPIFGKPVLRCAGVSKVGWVQDTGNVEALFQKGTSGYLANLYGGVQDGDDWAAVYIPVDELPVPDFESALWTYRLTNAESAGVNMVIWVHDPADNAKRCEITQVMGLVDKADGWNAHELDTSISQFFYFGEPDPVVGTGLTKGTNYTWAQYQADAMFKGWTIYRISFEYGWIGSSTLDDAWVADIKLNGQVIPLLPQRWDKIGRETKSMYQATGATSTTKATIITPNATRRVRIHNACMVTANSTGANFELYFHTGANIAVDATKAIAISHLNTSLVVSDHHDFGDRGPLGEIGEVVSMRTSANIATTGIFLINYHEE